ncbi:MAG: hypothetical protein AAGK74_13345 [Chloroflexota bacterium]
MVDLEELDIDEPTLDTADPSIRSYIVVAVALSLFVWDIAFNFGVYGVVFYSQYFTIWVICTAMLLASVMLPGNERPIGMWGGVAIAIPSLWLILVLFLPADSAETPIGLRILLWVIQAITVLNVPYIAYILIDIFLPQAIQFSRRLILRLIVVLVVIAGLAYTIGNNNSYFITCEDFQISGQDVPADCRE